MRRSSTITQKDGSSEDGDLIAEDTNARKCSIFIATPTLLGVVLASHFVCTSFCSLVLVWIIVTYRPGILCNGSNSAKWRKNCLIIDAVLEDGAIGRDKRSYSTVMEIMQV